MESALDWAANDPHVILLVSVVVLAGLIMLAVDCWHKWR